MIISVIIPCRNEKDHIREFLNTLENQLTEPEWELEILVADGRSDDGTGEYLRNYAAHNPNVRIIDNPGRIVSTGLNAAIQASTGDVIIRMDAHTVYADDYILQCVHVLEESGADNVGGAWVAQGRGSLGRAIAAAFQSPFCGGGGRARRIGYNGEVDTVYLGCWRRSAFARFGLFDPELVRNQDDELNFRIRRNGGRIVQSSRIQSTYTPRSSLRTLFRQYLQYGFWRVAVMRKHGRLASWRQAVPALFVTSVIIGITVATLSHLFHWTAASSVATMVVSGELALYIAACLASALPLVGSLELPALLAVPVIVAIHQIAYGLGFVAGLMKPPRFAAAVPGAERVFSSLTR